MAKPTVPEPTPDEQLQELVQVNFRVPLGIRRAGVRLANKRGTTLPKLMAEMLQAAVLADFEHLKAEFEAERQRALDEEAFIHRLQERSADAPSHPDPLLRSETAGTTRRK